MSLRSDLARKLRLTVSRAIVRLVGDAARLQELQVSLFDEEARATVERFQQYGFTAHPLVGAEAIALAVGGSRSHMVVLAVDDRRHRKTDLEPGEVAIYTDEGDYVLIKRGGTIEVVASSQVLVDAPEAEFTGNVHVRGNITCDGDVSDHSGSMQEIRNVYNAHTHPGVMSGSASTAVPAQEMD